jgi:hypothetical protein
MGIEHLTMVNIGVEWTAENWCLLFLSLSTHPRFECVSFDDHLDLLGDLSEEYRTPMMNAVLQMLQHNTVVHAIELPYAYFDD